MELSASFELRATALTWLCEPDVQLKTQAVLGFKNLNFFISAQSELKTNGTIPGLPEKPLLVSPLEVEKRSMRTRYGRACLIHALAHIEFNAINLALDAIWRFPNLPDQYYRDWLNIAIEEAYHFSLLNQHLETLGHSYGDFPSHNSLWEMAEKTKDDVTARMALVPRTLEARGLDACPAIREKLYQSGDIAAAEILDIILRDEIGHVAIGNHWFYWLCEQQHLEPLITFEQLCYRYRAPKLRPPFNIEARKKAGFSNDELIYLYGTGQ